VNKRILKLAIPNIISNITVPLLGAVDTAVIGHLESVYYLGAIAVGSLIFDFIFWGFGFLRMGTTGLVAQAHGSGNERETRILLYRVLLVASAASLMVLILQYPIIELGMSVINASAEVELYARQYFYIRILSAPATLCLFGINGWFLGMQNSRYPMYITITMNLINVIANLSFVYGLNMNVDGVAWGSVLASYLALSLAFILFKKKYSHKKYNILKAELLELVELKKFFSVNRDIFIRTICVIFTYAFFTAKSAAMGDTWLAANTILLQLWYISSYAVDGFAFAAESLVGKYTGAKNYVKLKQAIKASMIWGVAFGAFGTFLYALFGKELISMFTNNTTVIATAMSVVIWLVIAPLVNSVGFIWDGIYIGATATAPMRNSMLIATILFFIPIYYVAHPWYPTQSLWLAMTSFMLLRGLALTLYARKTLYNPKLIHSN